MLALLAWAAKSGIAIERALEVEMGVGSLIVSVGVIAGDSSTAGVSSPGVSSAGVSSLRVSEGVGVSMTTPSSGVALTVAVSSVLLFHRQ